MQQAEEPIVDPGGSRFAHVVPRVDGLHHLQRVAEGILEVSRKNGIPYTTAKIRGESVKRAHRFERLRQHRTTDGTHAR